MFVSLLLDEMCYAWQLHYVYLAALIVTANNHLRTSARFAGVRVESGP